MTAAPGRCCAACGRRLKRPSPSGLGPVCEKRLNPTSARPMTASTTSPIPVIEGQTVIELTLEAI